MSISYDNWYDEVLVPFRSEITEALVGLIREHVSEKHASDEMIWDRLTLNLQMYGESISESDLSISYVSHAIARTIMEYDSQWRDM